MASSRKSQYILNNERKSLYTAMSNLIELPYHRYIMCLRNKLFQD